MTVRAGPEIWGAGVGVAAGAVGSVESVAVVDEAADGVGVARVMGVWGWLAWAMRVATTAGPRDSSTVSSSDASPKTRTWAAGTQPAVPSAR